MMRTIASVKKIFNSVLRKIRPCSAEIEKEIDFANSVIKKLKRITRHEVILVGSVAKKTFLQDSKDIDIFILLEKHMEKPGLEKMLQSIVNAAYPGLNYQLSYAEHPYLRFHVQDRRIDLVPAYKIRNSSERISAVDRTVLHTAYIKRNLGKTERDHVLLLKKFLKANSLYGAEIKTSGFSGYLCELLIIRYGSFSRLAGAASKWASPVFIDLMKYYKTDSEKQQVISHFNDPLVVIDPTDRKRNVAAALSESSFKAFIRLCRRFMKSPSENFFLKEPITFEQRISILKKRGHLYVISIPKPDVVSDVLWGQLKKLMRQMEKYLSEFDVKEVLGDDTWQVRIAILAGKQTLPDTIIMKGPPVDMEKHVLAFRKQHKKSRFIKKGGHIHAVVPRKTTELEQALRKFLGSLGSFSHLDHPLSRIKISKIS